MTIEEAYSAAFEVAQTAEEAGNEQTADLAGRAWLLLLAASNREAGDHATAAHHVQVAKHGSYDDILVAIYG